MFNSVKEVAFIEIVVNHYPEKHVFDYCTQNGIPLLIFNISEFNDLLSMEKGNPLFPEGRITCSGPKCGNCNLPLYEKDYHVFEVDCKECGRELKAAFIKIGEDLSLAEDFTRIDLDFVKKHGVFIRKQTHKTQKVSYLAVTCKKCGRYIGKYNYHRLAPGSYNDPIKSFYYCMKCGKHYTKDKF